MTRFLNGTPIVLKAFIGISKVDRGDFMLKFHKVMSLILMLITIMFQVSLGYQDSAYQWQGSLTEQVASRTANYTALEDINPMMVQMLVMKEDRRFYLHDGFDPAGMARAMLLNAKAGKWKAGGSTITQQVAKNLFLNADRTIERKLRELVLAIRLDLNYSKNDILELYFNVAYFGEDAYGIGAAAQTYFHKKPAELTADEAAILVGLLPAPSAFNPVVDKAGANKRADAVRELMKSQEIEDLVARYKALSAVGF